MRKHLAIFDPEVIKQIFSGEKNIESRFSKARIAPFGQVSKGDLVYIKPPGKEIVGQFKVKKVIYFEGIDSSDLEVIKKYYNPGEKWLSKANVQYGTIILIDRVEQFITAPIKIKKKDLRGWMVLK